MTIHWSVVNQTGTTPLKVSPSSRSYELPKTYQLKVGPHEPLPTPCWNTDWLDLVWVLCGSCVGNHSCCELTGTHENSQRTAGRGQRTATPEGSATKGQHTLSPDSRTILGEEVGRLQELGVGEYRNKTAFSRCGGLTLTCTILCSCLHFITNIYLC